MDAIQMTNEQFERLLGVMNKARDGAPAAAAGLGAVNEGADKRIVGLGCGDGGMGPLASGVYSFLAAGSPRLALAKAMGIPLAPWFVNVRATFPDTTTSNVPDVGSDIRITQDTLIDAMIVRVENQSTTANQNQYQSESDYYFGFQSCIEATLDVQGAPRYAVAPKLMPIANLMDAFNGNARAGAGGWILTYNNQLKMNFNAKVTLPYAPMEVICTFRTWVPVWDELVQMTNREAIRRLQSDCGIQLEASYVQRCCR